METIANALTAYCLKKNFISEEKSEIYCYGFKLIIADIINFSLVLILAAIFNQIVNGIVFLITLCCVRKHSGGFHAKTFWLCRLSLMITFVCVLAAAYVVTALQHTMLVTAGINVACVIIISVLAPIRHPNKKLTDKQLKANKIKAIITSSVFAAASILAVSAKIYVGVTISITLLAIVILMIIGLVLLKGGQKSV